MEVPAFRTERAWGRDGRLALSMTCAILVVLTASCHRTAQKEAWEPVSLPIAYEGSDISGIMYFMNEADGTIQYGNRNPGQWLLSGPPSQEHLERCEASTYQCVTGWASLAPIVVGDMPKGVRQQFPELGIAVLRRDGSPCEVFETTPLVAGNAPWTQKVVWCRALGVVQVERTAGDSAQAFNLKSAVGLFGTALLHRRP
jgi:hypothetical protein